MNNKNEINYGLNNKKQRALYLIVVKGMTAKEAENYIVEKLPKDQKEYK